MAQKFVELSSSTTTDRLQNVGAAACHLSDGSCVFLEYDGTSVYLKHTGSGHGTPATIATLSGFYIPGDGPSIDVRPDSLDNLYVIGQDSTITHPAVRCQAFTKGAGYSWTAQTALVGANIGSQNNTRITETHAVWSNTTGGTNSKGHLMVIGCVQGAVTNSFYSILDAGAALNGSGTLVRNQAYSPTFLPAPPNASGFQMDLSADGFGGTSGLAIVMLTSTQVVPGNWAINSAGALTTNAQRTAMTSVGTMGTATKIRIVRYGANGWAIAVPSTTAGRYMIARYSATAQLTAPTDSGAPASMPLNAAGLRWDIFVDPVTATKVWVIALAAVAAGQQQAYRLGCAVGSGVVWDAATTTDDLLTNTNTTQSNLRAVKEPKSALVDWQAFVQTAASNYALDGDYTNFGSAPSAPTLTAPGNGAYVDVSAGVTLTAIYNSTDGANQSAVAIRQKIGAGAYSYWRASDSTWQAAIQWVPISTAPGASFSVPVTGLSNGNAYNVSMASQEASASLQGPFATDFVLNAQAAPTVVVNNPTGAQTISEPTISWTPTLAGGTSQTAYRAVVYNAAQYGAGGFTPGSGASVWDSGVVASAATSVVIGSMLPVGTFRAYVQITETGAETSAWAYSGFTTTFTPPAQPVLTGNFDAANARSVLNVQGRDNLLSENQASLETDTTGWLVGSNCSISRVTAQARDGAASLQLSSSAAGNMWANTLGGTSGVAVLPLVQYTALASLRAAVSARSCQVQVNWYKSDGSASTHASDTSGTVTDGTGGWIQAALTVTSPADAAYASVLVIVQSTGGAAELHYVDEISLAPGANTTWAKGGLTPGTLALVEYSDDGGTTWATVRGAAAVTIPTPSELATVYDYEGPPAKTRNYRATITGAGLNSLVSALLPLVTVGAWWLKDPLNPVVNVKLSVPVTTQPEWTLAENTASFRPLGRATAVVLADAVSSIPRPGKITCQTTTQADYLALLVLLQEQRTLLLQDMKGEQWYVRLHGRQEKGPDTAGIRLFQLDYQEVDVP